METCVYKRTVVTGSLALALQSSCICRKID
jgi:hypothetical protein